MKTFIAILIAAGVGFAGAYYYAAQKNEAAVAAAVAAAQADALAKEGQLNSALTNATDRLTRLTLAAPPYDLSPEQVVRRLALIDPSAPELRPRKIREIIHHLEFLVDAGTNSFEPIRHFVSTGADVDYTFDDGRPAGAASFWNWHPGTELRSGLVLPPSLRISLIDVMRYIGGDDAEASLAWMLSSSAKGMEIPYLAQALEKIAPGRYTDLALQAARNYLTASATNTAPSRAEALGNGYIYNWLASRGDTSMVAVARQTLVDSQGRFNAEAAHYLVNALKADAMDDLAKVYNNNASPDTKNKIVSAAFDYVGANSSANAMFKDWVLGSDVESAPGSINARPRDPVIRLLAGGQFGPFSAPVPTDPNVINGRLGVLNDVCPKLTTPRLQQACQSATAGLQALQSGAAH